MNIFFDESGFTGEDLMNYEQPVYTIASLALAEGKAQSLKKEFFPKIKSKELKHTKLRRKEKTQSMVIEFVKHILTETPDRVKVRFNHKKFQLITKMADFLTETVYYNLGQDFYANGRNIAFCNVFFTCFPIFIGHEEFSHFLNVTSRMLRYRKLEDYNKFISVLKTHQASKLSTLIEETLLWDQQEGHQGIVDLPSKALDDTLSMELMLMHQWATSEHDDFYLVHDQSGTIAAHKNLWEILTSPSIPQTTVGFDRRTLNFPLRVKETRLEDSKSLAGLQLADVMAGAITALTNWHANSRPCNHYAESLAEFVDLDDQRIFSGLWPSTAVTPEALDTNGHYISDPIRFITNILANKEK